LEKSSEVGGMSEYWTLRRTVVVRMRPSVADEVSMDYSPGGKDAVSTLSRGPLGLHAPFRRSDLDTAVAGLRLLRSDPRNAHFLRKTKQT